MGTGAQPANMQGRDVVVINPTETDSAPQKSGCCA